MFDIISMIPLGASEMEGAGKEALHPFLAR
jgi:hypothetical protein